MDRQWLKDMRVENNYLQREIAVFANITTQQYSMIETGYRNPSPDVAKRIGEILKFPWTLFYEEIKK